MFYEPKWDGFRCIIFRDGDDVILGSRGGKEMQRYFPEVVTAARDELPPQCVIDGELVITGANGLDFDLLSQRIHPAQKRIQLLAGQIPALFISFDLLAVGSATLMETSYAQRRAELEKIIAKAGPVFRLTPVTTDFATAKAWYEQFEGAGLDGLVCKPGDMQYVPGKRLMTKVKHERTADVVIAGFRWHKASPPGAAVGSLLLGLYGDDGQLRHVGVTAAFSAARRKELVAELEPLRLAPGESHPWLVGDPETNGRRPGTTNRWTGAKDQSWEPLRPTRVIEVRYDHMEGDRFRHTTQFVRDRPDREPRSCTYTQLEVPVRYDIDAVLSS